MSSSNIAYGKEGDGVEMKEGAVPNSSTTISAPIDSSTFLHTPCYCEENVYLLCKKLCMIGVANTKGFDLFVVFISNEEKQVPLWHQKASKRIDGLVLWDYHVICIQRNGGENSLCRVWDLDSSLPFPCPLNQYVTEAIRPLLPLDSKYDRFFRVVHAPLFFWFFASDRRHMKDPVGNWLAQPPAYEPIISEDRTVNNLDKYIRIQTADVITSMDKLVDGVFSQKYGVVVSQAQLKDFFSLVY